MNAALPAALHSGRDATTASTTSWRIFRASGWWRRFGALAAMEKALRWAIDYGHERNAFGQPIGKFQVWRHRFAEHLTAVEAGRWLTYHAR